MITDAPLHDLLDVPDGGTAKFVRTSDGVRVRVAFWGGYDRGTVLLLPGRTEYIEKYGRVITKLQERNFNVVVLDWRGQGLSDRPDDRLDRGYVDAFADYQHDVAAALSILEVNELGGPRLLFSHSMGGCIALRSLVNGIKFEAAVFSSPMWGLPGPPMAIQALSTVNFLGRPFGKHKMLVPGTKPGFYVLDSEFDGNELTNDSEHYDLFQKHLRQEPSLGLGGPTIHWAVEALREMDALFVANLPDTPILTFLGTEESVVKPESIEQRMHTVPNGQIEILENGKHEVWMETPDIQSKIWEITDSFLAKTV